MGWTCQHDLKGYCKLLKTNCIPGTKGCILKKQDGIIFSGASFDKDKYAHEEEVEIDFAKLAREN